MTDRAIDDATLDRLLALDQGPSLGPDFADRVVAEAQRPDRPRPAPGMPRHGARRRWTRRGIFTGIVAVNLVLASAVAAAIGGGAISVAKIADVAHRIVAHIHRPAAHHIAPRVQHVGRISRPVQVQRTMPFRPGAGPPRLMARPMPRPVRMMRPHQSPRMMRPATHSQRLHRWQRAVARTHPALHPRLHQPGRRRLDRPQRLNRGADGAGTAWSRPIDRRDGMWRNDGGERGWRTPFGAREFGPAWGDRRGGGGWRWRGGGRGMRGRRF